MGIKAALIVAVSLPITWPANAGFFTGNEMHQSCLTDRSFVNGFSAGAFDKAEIDNAAFFNHWLDVLQHNRSAPEKESWDKSFGKNSAMVQNYCSPKGITLGQVADIFCQYLSKNPSSRHRMAIEIFNSALSEAWVCKK